MLTFPLFSSNTLPTKKRNLELTLLQNMLPQHLLLGQQLQLFLRLKKSCELDLIPSKLLIECLDSIVLSVTDLFKSSLASGIFPQCFKSALVTPILKNRCLDHNDLKNHRPISNLCFIAKMLEKLVLSQVSSYINSQNLYNSCQSACCPGHSTETALLNVVDDLLISLSKGNISVLALHDICSAFDKIENPILAHPLHTDFGYTDTVLQWS